MFERLERREVFAVDLDVVRVDALFDHAMPGQEVAIEAAVANRSASDTSLDYVVEFRWSSDPVIDATDLLLAAIARPGLAPAAFDEWTQQVAIPESATHASYYVGMTLRSDGGAITDTALDHQSVAIVYSSLNGSVSYQGRVNSVAIRSYLGESVPILDDVPTWLVIHGRNSSPTSPNLVQLDHALERVQPGDQVLVLDWSAAAASGSLGGAGENFIKPVASWAASVLSGYGVSGAELNLVGHSWGAYVGAELAERMPASPGTTAGQVNSIIAVDPAVDYPGGSYNPLARGEVNFARNSKYSWAFYAVRGTFGSATTAATADEAFLVTASDHSKVVNVVADLFTLATSPAAGPTSLGGQFSFERLLVTHSPNSTWRPNSYDSVGRRTNRGTFEAVVSATSDGFEVGSLKFATKQREFIYSA